MPPPNPAAQQSASVLAHLNSALDWYHQMQGADRWVVQPSDEYYKNSQHDLASQVVTGAFGYARAMVSVIGEEGEAAAKPAPGKQRQERLATLAATNSERLATLRDEQNQLRQKNSGGGGRRTGRACSPGATSCRPRST